MSTASFQTTCCVVGGGPAGVMLGYLLARIRRESHDPRETPGLLP